MSRRIVAPILLLIAAAFSIAAVFAVHEIEAAGGPLSEPSAVPPFFSPDGDGVQDEVEISFTTKRPERITVEIRSSDGELVRSLMGHERVDGEHSVSWDGRGAAEGAYRAVITRAGDPREYETTERIVVDTTPPHGRIERTSIVGERLTGLALLEPGADLVFLADDGDELEGRVFAPPNPDAASAQPGGPVPEGLEVRLWYVEGMPDEILLRDRAGNQSPLDASVSQ